MPRASFRQFIELAVNMPEQEPQVGQADRSTSASCLVGDAPVAGQDHGVHQVELLLPPHSPASMGPPETKMAGMFSRMAAISMPGVILSQLVMQTRASRRWALAMYSTLSAISSREGRE